MTVKYRLSYLAFLDIDSIRHKGLRRLFLNGQSRGLVEVDRLRAMLAYLDAAFDFDELSIPPNYGLHQLTGNRSGNWAMTVTRNWRLTFVKLDERTIGDLDLEDYH